MKINCEYKNEFEDEEVYFDYGYTASICVTTYRGKKYVFDGIENCWTEGLESLYLKGNILYYCNNENEVLTPYDLAGVFYFSHVWEFATSGASMWLFNFLCKKMTVSQLAEKIRGHKGSILYSLLQSVDAEQSSQDDIMTILARFMPKREIKPYMEFASEVKNLDEIESIDIKLVAEPL